MELVQALALATPAFFVAYIAFEQWKLARNKLRLDLFSHRMEIFRAVKNTIDAANFQQESLNETQMADLRSAFHGAHFVFPDQVVDYISDIYDAADIWSSPIRRENRNESIEAGAARKKIADKYKEVFEIFGKHMKIR